MIMLLASFRYCLRGILLLLQLAVPLYTFLDAFKFKSSLKPIVYASLYIPYKHIIRLLRLPVFYNSLKKSLKAWVAVSLVSWHLPNEVTEAEDEDDDYVGERQQHQDGGVRLGGPCGLTGAPGSLLQNTCTEDVDMRQREACQLAATMSAKAKKKNGRKTSSVSRMPQTPSQQTRSPKRKEQLS